MRPKDGRSPIEVLYQFRTDNQIVALDQALIRQAMDGARTLLDSNQLLMVNVEPETLDDVAFWENWQFPLPIRQVVLEITERAPLEQFDLTFFHRIGANLALDDFGTGMSNLIALERIQPAWVKMGREFLGEHNKMGILSAIVTYSDRIGTKLVVEGIEHPSDVEFLKSIGGRYAQGFYLGTPKFAEEYLKKGSATFHVTHRN